VNAGWVGVAVGIGVKVGRIGVKVGGKVEWGDGSVIGVAGRVHAGERTMINPNMVIRGSLFLMDCILGEMPKSLAFGLFIM